VVGAGGGPQLLTTEVEVVVAADAVRWVVFTRCYQM